MRTYKRLLIIFCCTVVLFFNLFMCYTMPVFAKPTLDADGRLHVYNWDDIKDSAVDCVMYMASMAGAIFADHDFAKYVQAKEAWVDYWTEDNVAISENGTSVTFSQDIMAFIKQCIDDYAKENEPYFMVQTYPLNAIDLSHFRNHKNVYDTLVNLLDDSPSGVVAFGSSSSGLMCFTDLGHWFTRVSPVITQKASFDSVVFYNNETWDKLSFRVWRYTLPIDDEPIKTRDEFEAKAGNNYIQSGNYDCFISNDFNIVPLDKASTYNYYIGVTGGRSDRLAVITKTVRRIRVFSTYGDFQNYTLGKRSVYYTNNYYNYVPEDITTSFDDLQKSVDDLQNVIDDLLGQITKDTDESEIENLLQQILDELRRQQGTSGGGGSGGSSDVTVNVDLSTTNSWLEKIYLKITQLNDNFKSFFIFEDAPGINAKYITSLFERMLDQLRGISDDLDDIKGQLEDMSEQEFSDKTESFLDDTMGSFWEVSEKAKGKFPFSIPNDIRLLISKMSVSQPEEYGSGTYSVMTMAYEDDVGTNSLISVMDESRDDVPIISETGAPIFYLPFVIASAGIEQYVLIDLSGFEPISSFCRSLMTIWFVLCLYNLTFKVIGLWGDLVD